MSMPKIDPALASKIADISAIDVSVRADLEDLAGYIRQTKSEIMRLSPEEISDQHLPSASLELDAIVSATERATNSIMEAAERIEKVGEGLGEQHGRTLAAATTRIYEACAFQDITGQRISKVVRALQEIEKKVNGLVSAFGDDGDQTRDARHGVRESDAGSQQAVSDREPLEGPQSPDSAVSQDDVDALFKSLG